MIIEGKAVVIAEDNVDTDVLYPGSFLNIDDPEKMKPYLFEGYNPALRDQLRGDTILMAGANFGSGSSREHVPHALKAWNIRCVVGKSFARIFHRNCINLGLPALTCPEAVAAAKPGSRVRIDMEAGVIDVDGTRFQATPVPTFMREMVTSGGLVPWAKRRLAGAGGR
ncbi:MAG: 3-isopropylmalate dehydratase small subunit [Armatimonadetes bacterium]|nr:3-isopropylmalate dehydratase small subunit [Armatimonadota bacterium]